MPTKAEIHRNGLISRMHRNKATREALQAKLDEVERDRADLYVKARSLDPPIEVRQIAKIYGLTEAAVSQKVKRAVRQMVLDVHGRGDGETDR